MVLIRRGIRGVRSSLERSVIKDAIVFNGCLSPSAFRSCMPDSTLGIKPADFFPMDSFSRSFGFFSSLLLVPILALSVIGPIHLHVPTVPCYFADLLPRYLDSAGRRATTRLQAIALRKEHGQHIAPRLAQYFLRRPERPEPYSSNRHLVLGSAPCRWVALRVVVGTGHRVCSSHSPALIHLLCRPPLCVPLSKYRIAEDLRNRWS